MSEDLLRRLQFLEEDYPSQPPAAQQADLQEINQIRSQLGMPSVDAYLNEITGESTAEEDVEEEITTEPEEMVDHTEAREIYQAYLKKKEQLEVLQEYAKRVASATNGHGQTPVRPLATMGTDGGPLLCDHCKKPIVLEGGRHHGQNADVAWKTNPGGDWTSWILGGLVVEFQTNGTLRIYHGYPGRNNSHCCNVASRQDQKAREDHDSSERFVKEPLINAFLKDELPDLSEEKRWELLNDILDSTYKYDPGFGVNRPGSENGEQSSSHVGDESDRS